MNLEIDTYAVEAERFVTALDREYYLHFAGHKETFEIEPIYERHARLFGRSELEELRAQFGRAAPGDDQRRIRYLLQLAVEGFIGLETKAQTAELAERESALVVEVDGNREPYRQAAIVQANEPDPDRRLEIERARNALLKSELNPLHVEIIELAHELSVELGWTGYRAMYEDLKGVDLGELERQTQAFTKATDKSYRELVEPQLLHQLGIGFDALRRSDMPYFFRAPNYDSMFPAEQLVEALEQTLAGLGIDLRSQANVTLDLEQRPKKSARAFCAPVHVPKEVYLVIPRTGGRDDYSALFHEAGHTEHYATMDPDLPFEFRYLGDNSVTEGFAFLLEHLTEDPHWLRLTLGKFDVDRYLSYSRASNLIFLRRYAAKLTYELELHADGRRLEEMPSLYASLLGEAVGVEWPAVSYLSDVDDGFYVANYLRAWAFEASLRRTFEDRFGREWFSHREAGDLLRSIWREGQRQTADELLAELGGGPLDFSVMLDEVR
jgi:hypothetical protein